MLLTDFKSIFQKDLDFLYPKEEVESFFYLLIQQLLGYEKYILVLSPQLVITKHEEQLLFDALFRLKKEEPIQHILGQSNFMDLTIKISPNVLIPRPETEELVHWILEVIQDQNEKPSLQKPDYHILDVGTGSGCIAIALAMALPNAKIVGLDISADALKIARHNAEANQAIIELVQADILSLDENLIRQYSRTFDVIVSNPPYVRELEKHQMHNNVKNYEPATALFVPDHDPLKYYDAITDISKRILKPGGLLFFEINQYLHQESRELMLEKGFVQVELKQDIFGNFRMLKGVVATS